MFVHNEKVLLTPTKHTHAYLKIYTCMYSQRDGAYIHISQLAKSDAIDYDNCLRQDGM